MAKSGDHEDGVYGAEPPPDRPSPARPDLPRPPAVGAIQTQAGVAAWVSVVTGLR